MEDCLIMKVILASVSPRRKELLKLIIPEFEIIVSGIDESVIAEINGKYEEYKTYDEVKVFLKDISDEEIEKIEGNYHTVVGLPTHKVYEIMFPLKIVDTGIDCGDKRLNSTKVPKSYHHLQSSIFIIIH